MRKGGKFIVLEGTDGSGKTEQFKLLVKRLKREGILAKTFDFPQYSKESSFFVKQYLNGAYGGWKDVGPYKASIFYAMDRFDISPEIKRWLSEGRFIISNRYVASNMGHQGGKIVNKKRRLEYFKWLYQIEYKILEIPIPSKTIILHVPPRVSIELVRKKGPREYEGGIKKDIHDQDLKHLRQAEKSYLDMAKTFPRDFHLIECAPKGKLLPILQIHKMIWNYVYENFVRR